MASRKALEHVCYLSEKRCNDCPRDFPDKECSEYLKPSLNPVLQSHWETKADTKILKGGRSSSKTWDTAGFAIYLASKYKVKFLCVRQFQNRITDSVYANLVIQIDRFGLTKEFDIQASTIKHLGTGSTFHFYGMQRNTAEIKGFEGADICWIEEGEGLTREQFSIIEPTLKKEGSECWIVYNPRLETDFVETFQHNPKEGVIVTTINYDENPFLSNKALRRINALKKLNYEEYEHIYLGIPRSNDEAAIIKRSWIMAAVDAHVTLGIEISGSKAIGFDVADDGPDLNAQTFKHGIVALWSENWKGREDELLKSCSRVYRKAIEFGCEIHYDSIGVGAHCGAKFKELNSDNKTKIKHFKFNAGAKVIRPDRAYLGTGSEKITNKDFFSNLKAQTWWSVAMRFMNTYNAVLNNGKFDEESGKVVCDNGEKFDVEDLISISKEIPNLGTIVVQLSTPKKDYAKDGKVKVESKEDLKKRDIDSPNDADSFIMAYAPKSSKGRGFLDL